MEAFVTVVGPVAPLLEDDVNTGAIAGGTASLDNPDLAGMFFSRRRKHADGSEDPEFVFNRAPFRSAPIMAVGSNYGCGSSSESAVWAPAAFGIRCIVARSFADIYRENCLKNGILPVVFDDEGDQRRFEAAVLDADGSAPFTVNLEDQTISGAGEEWTFRIAPGERNALLKGLDDIGQTLEYAPAIGEFEQAVKVDRPWLSAVPNR